MRAIISVVDGESDCDKLTIRDDGGGRVMTVTNDAEAVVKYLRDANMLPVWRRLFYYDSEGNLDELLHDARGFSGFVVHRQTGTVMDLRPGVRVFCDLCGKDFTDSKEIGGIYGFGTKAIGPCCAERFMEDAKKYGEEKFLKASCPEGMPFADWVRSALR